MTPRILCCILSLLLAACTQLQSLVGDVEERQVLAMIDESQRFAALAAEEQRREVVAAAQTFNRERGTERSLAPRVRLAMLIALPGTAVSDDARAAALLDPVVGVSPSATTNGSRLRQFAALLHAQVTERLREARRGAQLKEQIDALRAIERTLIERSRPR